MKLKWAFRGLICWLNISGNRQKLQCAHTILLPNCCIVQKWKIVALTPFFQLRIYSSSNHSISNRVLWWQKPQKNPIKSLIEVTLNYDGFDGGILVLLMVVYGDHLCYNMVVHGGHFQAIKRVASVTSTGQVKCSITTRPRHKIRRTI